MSEPLYLKYRPQKLSELVGQEIIARTLTNAIKIDKIAHAYFFTGPRGCGKTSTARIIAKSINCKSGPTLDPCGVCTNCMEIAQGISPDVIEMDAASHRKLEDATQVIERAQLAPQTAKHKIYILDEVHMLTKEAFNALLKTIEEPPDNVIFILATTEEHKVPSTIVSRCQKFSFRPIETIPLINRLKEISEKENIILAEACYKLIAKQSRGGLRDALSLLDQISVLASLGETIEEKLVIDLLGSISEQSLNELLEYLIQRDHINTLNLIDSFLKDGIDPLQLIRNLIEFAVDRLENSLSSSQPNSDSLLTTNDTYRLIEIIDELNKSEYSLRNASQPSLKLKSNILSICVLANTNNISKSQESNNQENTIESLRQLTNRINLLERHLNGLSSEKKTYSADIDKPVSSINKEYLENKKTELSKTQNQIEKDISTQPINQESQKDGLINIIITNITSIPLKSLINISELFVISETSNSAILGTTKKNFFDKLNTDKNIKILENTLSQTLAKEYKIKIELSETNHSKHSTNVSEQNNYLEQVNTIIVNPDQQQNNNYQTSPESSIEENNIFEMAKHILGAKVIDQS